MPSKTIWIMIGMVTLAYLGVLVITIVQDNSKNIDDWWRAIDFKIRKRQEVNGNGKTVDRR